MLVISTSVKCLQNLFYIFVKVTTSMAGVVRSMDAAMKSLNLEKISALMDKFEKQFEDLDVQSSYMVKNYHIFVRMQKGKCLN